jgi:hypothetical protein
VELILQTCRMPKFSVKVLKQDLTNIPTLFLVLFIVDYTRQGTECLIFSSAGETEVRRNDGPLT